MTVHGNVGASLVNDLRVVDSNDTGSTSLGAEKRKNTSTTTNVQHSLPGKEVLIGVNEISVGVCANSILKHSLVNIVI